MVGVLSGLPHASRDRNGYRLRDVVVTETQPLAPAAEGSAAGPAWVQKEPGKGGSRGAIRTPDIGILLRWAAVPTTANQRGSAMRAKDQDSSSISFDRVSKLAKIVAE